MKVSTIILRLLAKTWRIKVHGTYPAEKCVLAFWHGVMLPVWKEFAYKSPSAIISTSRDGQILSDLLEAWDYELARGSSSKKGGEALEKLIEFAGRKRVLITPDGPRGPRHEAKAGAFVTAQRAGVPLVFCEVKLSKMKIFNKSWDKFELPLPFTKCNLFFSEPISISADMTREEIDKLILETNAKYA